MTCPKVFLCEGDDEKMLSRQDIFFYGGPSVGICVCVSGCCVGVHAYSKSHVFLHVDEEQVIQS